jgi:fermentation-respiration switch protein FrsA (DUF1100 family)
MFSRRRSGNGWGPAGAPRFDTLPVETIKLIHARKELYVVKGAAHGMAFETGGEEYKQRVTEFLKKHLP